MLFAGIYFERAPLQWITLPAALLYWVQNTGAVAAACVALFLLARTLQPAGEVESVLNFPRRLRFLSTLIRYAVIGAAAGYILLVLQWLGIALNIAALRTETAVRIRAWLSLLSGLAALFVVLTPLTIDLATRINGWRIWAIAQLSWTEARRGRVLWVFAFMALVFLFAEWFLPARKPEDQIRNYVSVAYMAMTVLFLVTAGLLGAFSVPADIRNNSIHTIVTKPVEKFEIVLGRFIGYGAILSVGLLVVSCLSLIYVWRGISEEAQQESYKARVPLYGYLQFAGTKKAQEAMNVGREWGYRTYITGPTHSRPESIRQFGIWDFAEVPAHVLNGTKPIRFEYSFDIFRLSTGIQDAGVFCTFILADVTKFANSEPNRQSRELETRVDELRKKQTKEQASIDEASNQAIAELAKLQGKMDSAQLKTEYARIEQQRKAKFEELELNLIKEFGIYQITKQEVTDQHTQTFLVNARLVKAIVEGGNRQVSDQPLPALRVFLSVDPARESQMVGVSRQDFYLLEGEKPFWQNFLKGALGMWFTHMLVLGVALAMSTYLSGVISLLNTFFLYIAGMSLDYLREVAERRVDGGGPLESLTRITTQMGVAQKLEASPTTTVIQSFDAAFSWWIGFLLSLVPDVTRHDLHQYVANGFDIGWLDVLFLDNALPLFGYLAPWAIFAYYLMKLREIANPT